MCNMEKREYNYFDRDVFVDIVETFIDSDDNYRHAYVTI